MDLGPLLAGILASPRDDLPRLVYADALEEAGQGDKAAFVRDQIRTGETSWGCIGTPADGLPCPWCKAGFKFLFRRGFVADVRCPLAGWVGGPCVCRGRPYDATTARDRSPVSLDCHHCSGTGRLPGSGPRLAREHPLEMVVIADREPWESGGGRFLWFVDTAPQVEYFPSSGLPAALMARIDLTLTTNPNVRSYPTREAAMNSLGLAALIWARSPRGIIAGPFDMTRDYTQDGFAAMEAAGRRLAMDRERRVLDAFFGDGDDRAR